jgi:hypothetical protein
MIAAVRLALAARRGETPEEREGSEEPEHETRPLRTPHALFLHAGMPRGF